LQRLTSLNSDFTHKTDSTSIQSEDIFVFIPPIPDIQFRYMDAYHYPAYHQNTLAFSNQAKKLTSKQINILIDSLSDISNINTNENLLIYRASLFSLDNQFNKAFSDYNTAEQINPSNPLLYFCKGNSSLMLGIFLDEISAENKAYNIEFSNDSESVNNEHISHYKNAIEYFTKAIESDPKFVYSYYNRAYTQCLLSNYEAGIQDFTTAIELNQKFVEALFNRGLTHIFTGDINKACLDLGKVGESGKTEAYTLIRRYCGS
jgi:tetratricopeptide (TPR) repeat protein